MNVEKNENNNKMLDTVKDIVAERLSIDRNKINPSSRITDDLEADSLDMVEIILCLEEKFEVSIPDEEATKITTVQEAMDIISKKIKEN